MRLIIILIMGLAVQLPVWAQPMTTRWSAEFKGGRMMPAPAQWETVYGKDHMGQINASLAYKVFNWFELGMAGGYAADRGRGVFPGDGSLGGTVVYETYPLSLTTTLRLHFSHRQWLVPYIGGGYDRIYYRISVHDDKRRKGVVEGSHLRAGLQVLLDRLDASAYYALKDMGVDHVYFVLEAMEREAESGDADLGGEVYSAGLLFEF